MASRRQSRVVLIARWSAEHRWQAVLAWVAFVVVCVGIGGMVGTRSQTAAQEAVGEWGRAERMTADGGFPDPAVENVLVTAKSGPLDERRATAAAVAAGRRITQMGVGLATAILLDATVVRAVLLPAAMMLLGRWNWWAPAALRRLPEPAVEEAPGEFVRI